MTENILFNYVLGGSYLFMSFLSLSVFMHLKNSTPLEYRFIVSKREFFLCFFLLLFLIAGTVAYQNLFSGFTDILIIWRIGLNWLTTTVLFGLWRQCIKIRVKKDYR